MKTIITGISGQDGYYLTHELAHHPRRVVGFDLVEPERPICCEFVQGDLTEENTVGDLIARFRPDEIYNLAAHTFVGSSWGVPRHCLRCNTEGLLYVLEACRHQAPDCRIYQASTSEMFGNVDQEPQNEHTPLRPVSPYGVAKVAAHHLCRVYRESYGMFVACGIGFNHESEIRPDIFVTRKITRGVARIARARKEGRPYQAINLGNLDAKRDWSHARDIAVAMRLVLEADEPDDWVVSSGESHSVAEFCEIAFEAAGMPLRWYGEGLERIGLISHDDVAVEVDEEFFRPNELHSLWGDSTKIRERLGWKPTVAFRELVEGMVNHDLGAVGLGI